MDKRFENITVIGRLCNIFMCMERYLLALYPGRDWTLVARKMWQCPAAEKWWDSEWGAYYRITPESIIKFKYDDDGSWNWITREEYEQAAALYAGLTDGKPEDEICHVLRIPFDMFNACDGHDYNNEAAEEITISAIGEIEGILKVHDIPLPDLSLVAEYVPKWDGDGELFDRWGMPTLGTEKLSIILNGGKSE